MCQGIAKRSCIVWSSLVEFGVSVSEIAKKDRQNVCCYPQKCERLELEVEVEQVLVWTSIKLPKDLPNVDETLQMLAGPSRMACEQGFGKVKVRRLQIVATLARIYKEILVDYLDYRGVEAQL